MVSHAHSGICAARAVGFRTSSKWLRHWISPWMWNSQYINERSTTVFCVGVLHAWIHHTVINGHWTSDQTGFQGDLLEKLMVCEVNDPCGVVLALKDLCCSFRNLPFTNTQWIPSVWHAHSGKYTATAVGFHGSWKWLGRWTSLWMWCS